MFVNQNESEIRYDAVLIGAGVMSCTLAMLLNELDPDLRLLIIERLPEPGLESSSALNNAGTGHAANCELNYTPLDEDGTITTNKALEINKAFELSLEFWSSLASAGKLDPKKFLNFLPHISFVWGESDVNFLKTRFEKLTQFPAFESMQLSTDFDELRDWMPLIFEERKNDKPFAGTRVNRGTDLDFGSLCCEYLKQINKSGSVEINFSSEVVNLKKNKNKSWSIDIKRENGRKNVVTPFVFIGAGGGALSLLQKSGVPEACSYGGFPVGGQWLICEKTNLANKHQAKVYGKAKIGAPPMSVPHLDTRWINGERSLLFGPFAGFSTKFLKQGSIWDFYGSINTTNIGPLIQAGLKNVDLVGYLLSQLKLNQKSKIGALQDFIPSADNLDWRLCEAGQRVQIIKKSKRGGILKMGTEVVSSKDGTLAALLGASPGASTAVATMLEVLKLCWAEQMNSNAWEEKLKALFPSMSSDTKYVTLSEIRERNNSILGYS